MDGIAGTKGHGFSFDGEAGDTGAIDPADIDGSSTNSGSGFGGSNGEQFDPAIHVALDKRNKDGSYTRKRGRKAGTSYSGSQAKASSNLTGAIEQLSNVIVFAHIGLAAATKCPELVLDKTEGDILAKSSAEVLAQFDIEPDPKTQAIIGLIIAMATVYGPRYFLISQRLKAERKEKADGEATVYNANGTYAGETTFTEVKANNISEPAANAGTM